MDDKNASQAIAPQEDPIHQHMRDLVRMSEEFKAKVEEILAHTASVGTIYATNAISAVDSAYQNVSQHVHEATEALRRQAEEAEARAKAEQAELAAEDAEAHPVLNDVAALNNGVTATEVVTGAAAPAEAVESEPAA